MYMSLRKKLLLSVLKDRETTDAVIHDLGRKAQAKFALLLREGLVRQSTNSGSERTLYELTNSGRIVASKILKSLPATNKPEVLHKPSPPETSSVPILDPHGALGPSLPQSTAVDTPAPKADLPSNLTLVSIRAELDLMRVACQPIADLDLKVELLEGLSSFLPAHVGVILGSIRDDLTGASSARKF